MFITASRVDDLIFSEKGAKNTELNLKSYCVFLHRLLGSSSSGSYNQTTCLSIELNLYPNIV